MQQQTIVCLTQHFKIAISFSFLFLCFETQLLNAHLSSSLNRADQFSLPFFISSWGVHFLMLPIEKSLGPVITKSVRNCFSSNLFLNGFQLFPKPCFSLLANSETETLQGQRGLSFPQLSIGKFRLESLKSLRIIKRNAGPSTPNLMSCLGTFVQAVHFCPKTRPEQFQSPLQNTPLFMKTVPLCEKLSAT
jgi:hypothetical protein